MVKYIPNGPCNTEAYKLLDPELAKSLAGYPENIKIGVQSGGKDDYWGKNKDAAVERFNNWVLS